MTGWNEDSGGARRLLSNYPSYLRSPPVSGERAQGLPSSAVRGRLVPLMVVSRVYLWVCLRDSECTSAGDKAVEILSGKPDEIDKDEEDEEGKEKEEEVEKSDTQPASFLLSHPPSFPPSLPPSSNLRRTSSHQPPRTYSGFLPLTPFIGEARCAVREECSWRLILRVFLCRVM
ncbi:hypothetical protein E2C01_034677 [Portunus trituberculatus]|uniref:Uncharacterized protein n=1 Tax=Portunus trituberculatus TaxID=210409 RepID=A0A5B7F9D0_PORTR|nr:hypothetical protein [Portunus trituberculatus]